MKATWQNNVIAEAPKEDLIYIEGNWYFPMDSVKVDMLRKSPTAYHCPWKGDAQYYDIGQGETWSEDSAFSYPHPKPSAIDIVKKDFGPYVAFWRDVSVSE